MVYLAIFFHWVSILEPLSLIHRISIRDQPIQLFYIALLHLYRDLCIVVVIPCYIFFCYYFVVLFFFSPYILFKIFLSKPAIFFFVSYDCRPCLTRVQENWPNIYLIQCGFLFMRYSLWFDSVRYSVTAFIRRHCSYYIIVAYLLFLSFFNITIEIKYAFNKNVNIRNCWFLNLNFIFLKIYFELIERDPENSHVFLVFLVCNKQKGLC